MKYCDKCKINVEEHLNYCPLCGRCVSKDGESKNIVQNYPLVQKPKSNNHFVVHLCLWVLILLNILTLGLEVVLADNINYFWHTLSISIVLIFGVLLPLKHNWSINSIITVLMVFLSGYMLFLELYTNSYGWGVQYAIPLFIFAVANFEIITICMKKLNRLEQVIALFVCFFMELGLFLYNYLTKAVAWPSLVGTFETFAFLFILFVIRYKKTKKELQKSFHI